MIWSLAQGAPWAQALRGGKEDSAFFCSQDAYLESPSDPNKQWVIDPIIWGNDQPCLQDQKETPGVLFGRVYPCQFKGQLKGRPLCSGSPYLDTHTHTPSASRQTTIVGHRAFFPLGVTMDVFSWLPTFCGQTPGSTGTHNHYLEPPSDPNKKWLVITLNNGWSFTHGLFGSEGDSRYKG